MDKVKISICSLVLVLGVLVDAAPSPHHHRDDSLTPVITFLKQLRKARKDAGGVGVAAGSILGGNREDDPLSSGEISLPSSSAGQSQQSGTVTPILIPSSSGGSSISNGGGSSNNGDRITVQFPSNFNPIQQRPPSPSSPEMIQRVNTGVSTILNGVGNFDLGQILRGAFTFPSNNNVKTVANNVIDTIFGPARNREGESSYQRFHPNDNNGGGGGSGGGASSSASSDTRARSSRVVFQ